MSRSKYVRRRARVTESLLNRTKRWARGIKRDVLTLWLAARDPRVRWPVKVFCAVIAAYAFSPIDLIPDFIPVVGYLDDIILLPLAIMLAVRLLPADLLRELRAEAARIAERPVSRVAAFMVVIAWIVCLIVAVLAFWPQRATI